MEARWSKSQTWSKPASSAIRQTSRSAWMVVSWPEFFNPMRSGYVIDLEGEGPTSLALHRHPAHLGELMHGLAAAEPSVAAVLYPAEGELRFVVDPLVVDVDDARLDPFR